jgi:hypothetical protein
MDRYDPEIPPDPARWLALDEDERLILVEAFHRDARIRMPRAARRLHAGMHAVVENQLAQSDEPVVRALSRLMNQGLSRHDAVHAVASVVARHFYNAMKGDGTPEELRAHYYAAVERLTAAEWHADDG